MQSLARLVSKKGSIGLVPTMGFLHEGHLSLIRKAAKAADFVIVTIFVNPAQFAPNEDLTKYPRDDKGDIEKIKKSGGDAVFVPRVEEIYTDDYQTYVNVEEITGILESRSRPTHFRGVTTIVSKLFNITRPDMAIFGMKDYQQAMVLKRMVRDLNYSIKIIVAPTIREKDGLAMSSRNKYFNTNQRKEAVCLYRALRTTKDIVKKRRIRKVSILTQEMRKVIWSICKTAKIDYIAFTDFESLKSVTRIDKNTICSLAVYVHGVRLIDNMKMM
jgi:pantoate--beta-alanine ligase